MQPSRDRGGVFTFGPFEADLRACVLRKYGVRIKLQAQPFQILAALLENAGNGVTRDELRQRLWPDNIFVDFEHGLNAAVTRLRQALGDSADEPRYIETLAKRGYRFIGKVEQHTAQEAVPSQTVAAPRRSAWSLPAIVLLAAASSAVFLLSNQAGRESALRMLPDGAEPLTAFRGLEAAPTLSPDGNQVAFTWNGEKQDNFDIYAMPVGSEVPRRLTWDSAEDVSPAWSPDGGSIAFIRKTGGDGGDLLLIPAAGGPEHKLGEVRDRELRVQGGRLVSLAWSPDGNWIAASHHAASDFAERIYLFSLTGEARAVTTMPALSGDHTPAFAPDGRALAFSRLAGYSTSELYAVALSADLQPAGDPRPLTAEQRWSVRPAWLPKGKRLLYVTAAEPEAKHELRMIRFPARETSGEVIMGGDDISDYAVGRRLVYSRRDRDTNIHRARVPRSGEPPATAEPFASSTRRDEKPRYSPDGKKVAFMSSRSGAQEIWVAKADGSSPVRLTAFGGPLVGYASWSPDGQWLTFHARPEGQADLFVMPAAGGTLKRLTTHAADDVMPSYSHDGSWIYFSSARSGRQEIWRMPAGGGEPVRLTVIGGQRALESPDGQRLVCLSGDAAALYSIGSDGGPPVKLAGPLHPYPVAFAVTKDGVFYGVAPREADRRFIEFRSFSTGETRTVAVAHRPFYLGMSVSPDGEYILFDQIDELERDLMVVRDFRP